MMVQKQGTAVLSLPIEYFRSNEAVTLLDETVVIVTFFAAYLVMKHMKTLIN